MKAISIHIVILFLCVFVSAYAQQGFVPASGEIKSSSYSISYSIGQLNYSHAGNTEFSIIAGIQQPFVLKTNSIECLLNDISLFPNPFTQSINISNLSAIISNNILVRIVDINGNIVFTSLIQNDIPLDLEHLRDGIYLIYISDREKDVFVKKIIKVQ